MWFKILSTIISIVNIKGEDIEFHTFILPLHKNRLCFALSRNHNTIIVNCVVDDDELRLAATKKKKMKQNPRPYNIDIVYNYCGQRLY